MTTNKYQPLSDYLKKQTRADFVLSFQEIEDVLGFGLPRSAQRAEWWGEDSPEHPRLQREAIRDAGYDAKRLPDGKGVRFRKAFTVRL